MSDDELRSFTWSGEKLDIVLTSLNNSYGKERIWHAMQYGVFLPISKYIDELVQITGATIDDKSEKRKIRLAFLRKCEDDSYLNLFFILLLCWLNGGGDKIGPYIPGHYSFSQYYQQKLILTVSGGNIITIFAKLLQNIMWASMQSNINEQDFFNKITTTNREILNELENYTPDGISKFTILNYIKGLLFNDSGELLELSKYINRLLEISYFSDFDYGIVPNKDPVTKDMSDLESSTYISSIFSMLESELFKNIEKEEPQGFTLFRVKTVVKCDQPKSNGKEYELLKTGKQNCLDGIKAGVIPNDIKNRLTPQQINSKDKNIPALESKDYEPCKSYIEFLLRKKEVIQTATKFNIITIIKYFSENLSNNKLASGQYTGPNDWELEAIIFYINYTSYHLNEYIKIWEIKFLYDSIRTLLEENPQTFQYPATVYESLYYYMINPEISKVISEVSPLVGLSYFDICKLFLSLKSIVESEYLLSLSSLLIIQYLNFPGPLPPLNHSLSEKILDKIVSEIPNFIPCPSDPIMLPAKITFVNSTDNKELSTLVKKYMVRPLQEFRLSELGFPDGINIVINIITPTEVTIVNPVNKLSTLFDELSVVGTPYTAHEEMLKPRLRGGKKTKKVKKTKKSKKTKKIKKTKKSKKTKKVKKFKKVKKVKKVINNKNMKKTKKYKTNK